MCRHVSTDPGSGCPGRGPHRFVNGEWWFTRPGVTCSGAECWAVVNGLAIACVLNVAVPITAGRLPVVRGHDL